MSEILIDLSDRWRRARRAALLATAPGEASAASATSAASVASAEDDELLLRRALEHDREGALKRVFENSLRLGTGFARYFGSEVPLGDLPTLLPRLGAPCLAGRYRPSEHEPAYFVEQPGCGVEGLGVGACDWWREAIEGLVLGITGGIFYTRHASAGRGGDGCTGVLYVNPESGLRFGPIPDDLREATEAVRRTTRAFHSSLDVEFLGVNEGALFYRLRRSGCSDTPLQAKTLVERGIHRRFPGVELREVTERSVLGTDGSN